MASITWQAIIDRAKVYVDDDHSAQKSWIKDDKWLAIANAEYATLYKRWVRGGLVTPAVTSVTMTTGSQAITGVLAIIGVGKDTGGAIEMLEPSQPVAGRDPFWRSAEAATGPAREWTAYGLGDALTVELDPVPSDITSYNYIIRYVPTPTAATALSQSIELPYGADELLVLGIARRAHLKDSGASRLLESLIFAAEAELNFSAAGKVNGPRVRRSTPNRNSWPQRQSWRFY